MKRKDGDGLMTKLPVEIRNEIDALETMDARKLRREYGELITDASACKSSSILRQLIAYRLQARFYGVGLSESAKEWMSKYSEGGTLGVKNKPMGSGARLMRTWKGTVHEVRVIGEGRYEHNGVKYKSLSAIAKAITGTQWNGKLFFGVK